MTDIVEIEVQSDTIQSVVEATEVVSEVGETPAIVIEVIESGPQGPKGDSGEQGAGIPEGGELGEVLVMTGEGPQWFSLSTTYLSVDSYQEPYQHTFTGLQSEVVIEHNLDKAIVQYVMVDGEGRVVQPAVTVIDSNSLCVGAGEPLVGTIYIY